MKLFQRILVIVSLTGLFVSSQVNAADYLRLATTTSTDNSGLLSVLNPVFEGKTGIQVQVIAVGTGKALRLARDGDVDVVMVHAPAAEKEFVEKGFGIERQPLMYNDFVILGPSKDPANIRQAGSVKKAFRLIEETKSTFVSRGDDSGTHKKELQLWQSAGIPDPAGRWYLSVGQGMGQTLRIADEKEAYLLSDRGTYLAYADNLSLEVLYEGGQDLLNPYHVMIVNPKRHPHVQLDKARAYIRFLTSEQGQSLIREFKVNGKQLFHAGVIN